MYRIFSELFHGSVTSQSPANSGRSPERKLTAERSRPRQKPGLGVESHVDRDTLQELAEAALVPERLQEAGLFQGGQDLGAMPPPM